MDCKLIGPETNCFCQHRLVFFQWNVSVCRHSCQQTHSVTKHNHGSVKCVCAATVAKRRMLSLNTTIDQWNVSVCCHSCLKTHSVTKHNHGSVKCVCAATVAKRRMLSLNTTIDQWNVSVCCHSCLKTHSVTKYNHGSVKCVCRLPQLPKDAFCH